MRVTEIHFKQLIWKKHSFHYVAFKLLLYPLTSSCHPQIHAATKKRYLPKASSHHSYLLYRPRTTCCRPSSLKHSRNRTFHWKLRIIGDKKLKRVLYITVLSNFGVFYWRWLTDWEVSELSLYFAFDVLSFGDIETRTEIFKSALHPSTKPQMRYTSRRTITIIAAAY